MIYVQSARGVRAEPRRRKGQRQRVFAFFFYWGSEDAKLHREEGMQRRRRSRTHNMKGEVGAQSALFSRSFSVQEAYSRRLFYGK